MTNPWSNLPNAVYIDKVLDHYLKNLPAWTEEYNNNLKTEHSVEESEVYWKIRKIDVPDEVFTQIRDILWAKETIGGYYYARDAILALVKCENCSHLFEEDWRDVRMLGILGNDAAVLLYPAIKIMSGCV